MPSSAKEVNVTQTGREAKVPSQVLQSPAPEEGVSQVKGTEGRGSDHMNLEVTTLGTSKEPKLRTVAAESRIGVTNDGARKQQRPDHQQP